MSVLVFTCPNTKRVIDSGIETDPQSLAEVWLVSVRVRCPHCGDQHEPQVWEGRLQEAA